MQPGTEPYYCFLLAMNLFLAFLKAMGVPTKQNSTRMMFLVITFLSLCILSVMVPQTNLGRQRGDFRLPQTAASHTGPTQSHPRRFSIALTVLYLASNYCTPTSFLWTLTTVLILQRWQPFLFNCFKYFICWLPDALRPVPTNNVAYTVQPSETTQLIRPNDADLEANPQGHAALRPVPTLNIDCTVQVSETTQLNLLDDSDMEGNLQGEDTNNM